MGLKDVKEGKDFSFPAEEKDILKVSLLGPNVAP